MQTITVKRTIKAPPEKVFALLSEHEAYTRFPGVSKSVLEQPGKAERNGIGAVRRIESGRLWFVEEITAFERPGRLGYRITRSILPLDHQGANIVLRETPEGTAITWTSTFRVTVPLLGGVLEKVLAPQFSKGYAGTLKALERMV
jgi:uncharacterized protein YndB with AHSA1/START domain